MQILLQEPVRQSDTANVSPPLTISFETEELGLYGVTPFELDEIPESFEEGLKDLQQGRVIDIDIAHQEPPPF